MRNIRRSFALAIFMSGLNALAAGSTKELPWSSVKLEGAQLRLVSPKEKDSSVDLSFGKNGILAITSCFQDTCTAPVTVWKIESNRLKTGYAPTEGDALIAVSASKLTLREPSGKIVIYEISRP